MSVLGGKRTLRAKSEGRKEHVRSIIQGAFVASV